MIHQKQYKFLEKEYNPKVITELVKVWGIKEIVGKTHNKTILNWAKYLDLEKSYTSDEIPWCGLLVAYIVKQAGFEPVKNPLWARSWLNFGTEVKKGDEKLGDILVFGRDGGGHVGFYIGEDDTCFHVGGGNQSNMVNGARILKKRLLGCRRCEWKISEPKGVRKIKINNNGVISLNEQ